MKTITVNEFIENWKNGYVPKKRYIKIQGKLVELGYIRWPESNPWAVCLKENGRYGLSYMVCYDTPVYIED